MKISMLILNLIFLASANADSTCKSVQLGETKIEPRSKATYTILKVIERRKMRGEAMLEMAGPDHKCISMKSFSELSLVMVRHRSGAIGTSVLVQKELLSFYRLKDGELELVDEVELSHTEQTGDKTETLFKRSFDLEEKKDGLRVIVRESTGGGSKEYLIR